VQITLFNSTGQFVDSATLSGPPTGTINGQSYYDYTWTARKASGTYYAVIHGHAVDGSVVKTRVKFAVIQ